VVIGGGAARMSAAPTARRSILFGRSSSWGLAASPAYGLCGLPYYLRGVVRHSDAPRAYPPAFFRKQRQIDLQLHSAVRLDPHRHVVHYLAGGWGHRLSYQQAAVTADGTPNWPSIHGLHHPRAFGVRTLEDAVSLRGLLDAGLIDRALVVGADYLGLEMAAALVHQCIHVVLVELTDRVLGTVDPPLVDPVSDEVRRHGIDLRLRMALAEVRSTTSGLSATIGGRSATVDAVIVAADAQPAVGRLLGRAVGGRGVAKQIDVVAVALHAGLGVDDLTGLDLSYAPPHASVYEPVLLTAQAAAAHEPIPA
jgi:CoA-dependent NAD(P)H sulfur oxidoreductase